MKAICFFSGDITRSGGTERVAVKIANCLAAEERYRVLFLSLVEQKPEPFFAIDGRISRFALGDRWIQPGPGYLAVLPRLRKFLRREKIDILIDIDIVLDALSIPTAGSGTKVISWGHFSYYFEQSAFYRKMILRYAAKHADYCITINEENYNCYRTFLHREKNHRMIYNPMEEPARTENVPREKWILWVGRLVEFKGVGYLAETAAKVLRKHPDWKWIVLGDGGKRGWLEQYIEDNGLRDRFILKGTVADVAEYYARASIFTLTSMSKSEGLPMCLLEAKGYRLPSVSFDIHSGPSEIIRDGVNGYLIPPYDCDEMARKIDLLIEDEELRGQFEKQTALDCEKFELGSIMLSWNEVIKSLCS